MDHAGDLIACSGVASQLVALLSDVDSLDLTHMLVGVDQPRGNLTSRTNLLQTNVSRVQIQLETSRQSLPQDVKSYYENLLKSCANVIGVLSYHQTRLGEEDRKDEPEDATFSSDAPKSSINELLDDLMTRLDSLVELNTLSVLNTA